MTNTGKDILCEKCVVEGVSRQKMSYLSNNSSSPTKATATKQVNETVRKTVSSKDIDPNNCAGCGYELKEGQALIALDRQWHIWCFR